MYNSLIIDSNKIYDDVQHKTTANSRVLWDDAQKQAFRFHELYTFVSSHTDSILDIGCGNGELLPFSNSIGHTGEYSGVDINEHLIAEAKSRFPNHNFYCSNILENTTTLSADNVIISGVFNVNFGQDLEFIQQMIKKSFSLAHKKLIFNAISTHVNFRQECMFYINPSEMLDFCIQELSPIVTIRHGHLSHNYTVCVDKQAPWKSINAA